jgi:D-apionolactonase
LSFWAALPRRPRPRQAWTLGYIAGCARGGIEAVAIGAPTGPFGFIDGRAQYGVVTPAFHVMAGLAALSGKPLLHAELSAEGAVEVIAVRDGGGIFLWIANLTAKPQRITLPVGVRSVALLNEASFAEAVSEAGVGLAARLQPRTARALDLSAYAVACTDIS